VPLSPWLIALMLLVGALFVGGLSLYAEKNAISVGPTSLITTASGSMTLMCTQTHWLGTSVPGGVTLTVTPLAGVPDGPAAVTPSLVATQCATGTHLNPGDLCYLCVS